MILAALAAVAVTAVAEAVVHFARVRTIMGPSAVRSGIAAVVTVALRVLFVLGGWSAIMEGAHPVLVVSVYAGAAGAATWIVQARADRGREGGRL